MIILYILAICLGLFILFLLAGYVVVTLDRYRIKRYLKKLRKNK